MAAPFTRDTMTDITLYGRVYPVEDGKVTIPVKDGAPYVVTLATEGLKRKDWYYDITRPGEHYLMVDFNDMQKALHLSIKEERLCDE